MMTIEHTHGADTQGANAHAADGLVTDGRHRSNAWSMLAASLAIVCASLLTLSTAFAATFEVHRGDDLNVLVVSEEILPGDDERFMVALNEATGEGEGALVVLASPGGALGAGMHIGLMIAEAGLPTFVPENEVCASACALAWLAGAPRMMTTGSEIGFHQPYDELDGEMIPSIEANAVVGHYIATIGMGPEIVSFAVSAPPDRMAWLDMGIANTIGLDTVEVASSGMPLVATADVNASGVEGADRRIAPTDEAAIVVAGTPVPVMRRLTAQEVASVQLTGTVDGTGEAGGELPLVTAFTTFPETDFPGTVFPEDAAGHEPDAFAPLGGQTAASAVFDTHGPGGDAVAFEDELLGYDVMEDALRPVAFDTDAALPDGNVERAVLDALRRYGFAGAAGLRDASAACWRELRDAPSLNALQYCHVFDLVSEGMVDPRMPGDFAHFAVEARLHQHRDLVLADALREGYAADWRSEATMVVSMMTGR